MYASFMKPGDKEVDTSTSARMIGDVALYTGGFTFTPASGKSGSTGFWTKVVGKVGGEWKILNRPTPTRRLSRAATRRGSCSAKGSGGESLWSRIGPLVIVFCLSAAFSISAGFFLYW